MSWGFVWCRLRHPHLKAKAEEQAVFQSELQAWLDELASGVEIDLCRGGDAAAPSYPDRAAVLGRRSAQAADGGRAYSRFRSTEPRLCSLGGPTPISVPKSRRTEFAQFLHHLLTYYPGEWLLVIHDRAGQHQGAPIVADRLGSRQLTHTEAPACIRAGAESARAHREADVPCRHSSSRVRYPYREVE